MDAAAVRSARPVLIAGNMCDARLWTREIRATMPGAIDADTTRDDTVDAMALRALASADGPLLPVGFSMGGIVALAMARLAPDRIAALVLLDTNPSGDLPARAAARPGQQEAARRGELERIVVEELKPNYLSKANRDHPDLRKLLRDMALDLGADVFVAQSEALRKRPDQRDVLPDLGVPILIACGAEDGLCPPDLHREMADAARVATLRIIDDAGHMLPLEQPGRVAQILSDWRRA